jgi:hypothetical protein
MTQHVQRAGTTPPSNQPLPQPDFQKIQKICTERTQFSTPNTNKTINIILKNTIGFAFGFPPAGRRVETIALAGALQDPAVRTSEAYLSHPRIPSRPAPAIPDRPPKRAHRPHCNRARSEPKHINRRLNHSFNPAKSPLPAPGVLRCS